MIPPPALLQPPSQAEGPLASLIRAEWAFADDARIRGMRRAFLAVWHPEGLLFTPQPVNGSQHYRELPESSALLSWYPAFAEVDAGGSWAYTSGPWEFREDPAAKEALRRGRFFSVWHRAPGGPWRLMADGRCPGEAQDRSLPRLLPGHPALPARPVGLKPEDEPRFRILDLPRLPAKGQLAVLHGTEAGRIWFRLWFKAEGIWHLRIAWEESP